MRRYTAFLILLAMAPCSSVAWGPEGHRIVAEIAKKRLSATARQNVVHLLGNDDLAAISVWADDIRSQRPETFAWHFVDIPMQAPAFSEARDCYHPDEKLPATLKDHRNCVVDRIQIFQQMLADAKTPREKRIEALKFVVHFIADVHQPMHAIGEARGGNDIHVVFFGSTQCGKSPCNLHYTWDTGLLEHAGITETQFLSKIENRVAADKMTAEWVGAPAGWANESFRVARKVWLNDGGTVDEQYYKNNIDIVEVRLQMAGLRLAALLNQALGK